MFDASYSGRNASYRRLMDSHDKAVRNAETRYAREIQDQVPGITRGEALRIATKWAIKDTALT